MPYDERLAERVRAALADRPNIEEKRMFGGLAFLLAGKMFCGIAKEDLMVRVGPDKYEEALGRGYARPMDFTGRPMRGYVFVAPGGCATKREVSAWIEAGLAFVSTLETTEVRRSKSARGRAARGKRNT